MRESAKDYVHTPMLLKEFNHSASEIARKIMEDTFPLWRRAEDVALRVEDAVIKQTSGNLTEGTMRFRITETRANLAEPGDTELEEMLIKRVVLCWMVLNEAEMQRAQLWQRGEVKLKLADYWDKRVSRLHSDYLKACQALARVRKLRRPVIQVNVADKQINTVGPIAVDARNSDVQINDQVVDADDALELEETENSAEVPAGETPQGEDS